MKFFPIFLLLFSFNLSQANDLAVEVNSGFCSSAGSGQAIVLATGGVEPYTFQWSDPLLEGEEVFDLNPGTYSLTVTDASACEIFLPYYSEFGWDGNFNGKAMDNGVFLYQVTAEYIDDTVEDIFGTVTLFR